MKKIIPVAFLSLTLTFMGRSGWAQKHNEVNLITALTAGYDDNITFVKNDKIGDVITSILVGLGLKQERKTYSVEALASVKQNVFIQNGSFNNFEQDIWVKVDKELSPKDHLQVQEEFTHAEEPRSFDDEFGEVSGRYEYYRNNFGINYKKDINTEFSMQTKYANQVRYVSRSDLSDSTMNKFGLELDYSKSPSRIYSLAYDFLTRDFSPGPQGTIHSILAGVRNFFSKSLYLDLKAGPALIDSFTGDTLIRPTYMASLVKDIDANTNYILTYEGGYDADRLTSDVFKFWNITSTLRKQLSQRINGFFALFYGEGEFITTNVSEKHTGVKSQLDFEIKENVTTFIAYNFTQKQSNTESREFSKNTVYVGLNFIF